jgi:RNA polymerase sigma factor (sigma-70 family)
LAVCEVTDSEIRLGVPDECRERVDELAEKVRRRAADAEMFNAVVAGGFRGRVWQVLGDDLVRYGLAVVEAWLRTGYVFAKALAIGRPMYPTDLELQQLRTDDDLRAELADAVVVVALVQFRDQALAGTGWSPEGGAALNTYFIGGCLRLFNNEFRRWRGLEKRWRMNVSTDPADFLAAEADPVEGRRVQVFDDPARATADHDQVVQALAQLKPREQAIVELYADGYTYDEIAEITGTTRRGVEGVLYRIWKKDIRSRLEGRR